jgi:hypothetical protein
MGRLVLIDALAAITSLVLWYFGFSRYNRRRGAKALRRVEAACSGRGRIVEARWFGACQLQARMKFFGKWLESGQVTLRLRPRPIPFQWFLSSFRKEKETLTFETDLDWAPNFDLQVYRHRWVTHKQQSSKVNKNWSISRPGPVVLTTRTQWTQELTPVVNALMMSRGHNLVSVRFRQESPQLAATIPLDALSGEQEVATFLNVVHDLATGASASRL